RELFHQPLKEGEKRKIILWFDKDQEFTDIIDEIVIENVKIHKLTENNQFYTKYLLEEEDPTSHYLIYSNLDMGMEENWLIDTVLYSRIFYADKVSLIMNEQKIDPSLRSVV